MRASSTHTYPNKGDGGRSGGNCRGGHQGVLSYIASLIADTLAQEQESKQDRLR
jgi:hypothetical protein